jgi:hypothetical protein
MTRIEEAEIARCHECIKYVQVRELIFGGSMFHLCFFRCNFSESLARRQGQYLALRPLPVRQFRYETHIDAMTICKDDSTDMARHNIACRLSCKCTAKHAVDVAFSNACAYVESHGREPFSAYRDAASKKLPDAVALVSSREARLAQWGSSP